MNKKLIFGVISYIIISVIVVVNEGIVYGILTALAVVSGLLMTLGVVEEEEDE